MFKTLLIFGVLGVFSTLGFSKPLPEGYKIIMEADGKITVTDKDGKKIEPDSDQLEEITQRLAREGLRARQGEQTPPQEEPLRNRLSEDRTRLLTEEEYQNEQRQLQRQRQRDQLQRNIQDQLKSASGGGGGGRGGGGGGGGGGGSGGSSGGGSQNSPQPLQMSSFGTPPDFSKGNKSLESLVSASQKGDDSEKLMQEIKKQLDSSSQSSQPLKGIDGQNIPDFSQLINELLSALNSISYQATPPQKLVENGRVLKRRRTVGRPLPVPSGLGLVSGQSDPAVTGGRIRRVGAGLAAGVAPKKGGTLVLPERTPASNWNSFQSSTHQR